MVLSLESCLATIKAVPPVGSIKCWLLKKLKQQLRKIPQFRFIILHYSFFIAVALLSSTILYGASLADYKQDYPYVDCLFLAVSAITETGLITVTPSQLNFTQQLFSFLLIIIGSPITVSIVVLFIRKRAFHKRFCSIIREQRAAEVQRSDQGIALATMQLPSSALADDHAIPVVSEAPLIAITNSSQDDVSAVPQLPQIRSANEIDEAQAVFDHTKENDVVIETKTIEGSQNTSPTIAAISQIPSQVETPVRSSPLLSVRIGLHSLSQFVGRNGQFHGLTTQEREALGCVEYNPIKLLTNLVPCYFIACQALGALVLAVYFRMQKAELCLESGINPVWMGVFHSVSSFNNAGIMFLDDSMGPFKEDKAALLVTMVLMLAGNVCFPILLRAILWTWLHILPTSTKHNSRRETILFILRYPRRVYTHLFPTKQTLLLCIILVIMDAIDWSLFEFLNPKESILHKIPYSDRVLDGLFQSVAIRFSGFTITSLAFLPSGLQLLYVIMMFVCIYPVVITMRSSNIYQERSLGVYQSESHHSSRNSVNRRGWYFLREQLERQLGGDLWVVTIMLLIVVCVESVPFTRDNDGRPFVIFDAIFECFSAYSGVGLSMGAPGKAYSLSGAWSWISKVLICILMMQGRHRELPVAIDSAIQFNLKYSNGLMEEQDHDLRHELVRVRSSGPEEA